ALDFLPYDEREALGIFTAEERAATVAAGYGSTTDEVTDEVDVEALSQGVPVEAPARKELPVVGSSTELLEAMQGTSADAPLCMTCGTKMRPAGSCYVCEGCGSTSGCS
ncbi:MAG: ribonucleoside-diphosphate reductase, adenosylcobalamin-dependent, partial [Frankiales bacterium]|nr:ribonucleoside-diphosphate reductase, adenosylcobalamin-dependent [Frankiales bacterium]